MGLKLVKESQTVVFTPPEDYVAAGSMYPRVIELHHAHRPWHPPKDDAPVNGTLLASFEEYRPDTPVFPIYRSDDHGKNWYRYSEVPDLKNGWGNKFQPHLFEFPCRLGEFPAGTLMIAGNSIPKDHLSTEIVCYISRDHGRSWEYLSTVVSGGAAMVDGQELTLRPVWEPFLMLDKNGDLVCYYSDERFSGDGYNQLLAYQVSRDGGKTWGEAVRNVAIPGGIMRPGMPVIDRMGNGRYLMTYEIVGLPRFDLYFKTSDDGLDWGDPADFGKRCETADGRYLGSTPYCLWVPQGGPCGTLIASARRDGDYDRYRDPCHFIVNYSFGEGPWELIDSGCDFDARVPCAGYSQGMCLSQESTRLVHLCPVQISSRKTQIVCTVSRLETV